MPKFSMTKKKFINQWLRCFATKVDKEKSEQIIKDQYIWHMFSFELINKDAFLSGDPARQAYNAEIKSECIFCDMFGGNGVADKMLDDYVTAKTIDDKITELYVVSKDYSWTYIKTHEGDLCGPYFMKIK